MTITRFRKGQLSVPLLYAPIIDTLSGGLSLRREGGAFIQGIADFVYFYRHPRLTATIKLQDDSGGTLIRGDGSGNIDQLGRIDCAVTNPTGSQEAVLSAHELVATSQSGTLSEGDGGWSVNANDSLYLFLNSIFHRLMLRGNVHIESITVYMNSDNNGAYISVSTLSWYSVINNGAGAGVSDGTDIGNGSTGDENGVLTVNHAILENYWYRLSYAVVVGAGNITIRGIKIKYRLT